MKKSLFVLLIICTISITASCQNFTFVYKRVAGLNLDLDVYVPSQNQRQKYPVLFTMHYGAFVGYSKEQSLSDLERKEALSYGFVYVTVNYRLNPGVLLPDIIEDVQDAYAWVRTELVKSVPIDVDAIISFGRSAGGGLALLSGSMFNPRPRAIIAFYPYCANFIDPFMYDSATPVSQALIDLTNSFRRPVIAEYFQSGFDDPINILLDMMDKEKKKSWIIISDDPNEPVDQVLATLKKYSAVNLVDQYYPPTYLLQGENDSIVPYNQSTMMADALRAKNINYTLDIVPQVEHLFDDFLTDVSADLWQDHLLPVFNFAARMTNLTEKPRQTEKENNILLWILIPVLAVFGIGCSLLICYRKRIKQCISEAFSRNRQKLKREKEGTNEGEEELDKEENCREEKYKQTQEEIQIQIKLEENIELAKS